MDKYSSLRQVFMDNSNQETAIAMQDYMRNMFPFFGIQSSKRKEITKEFIKTDKKTKVIDWEFLDKCNDSKEREFHYFMNDYLDAMKNLITYDDLTHIYSYIKKNQWWDTIDFYDKIYGEIGLTDKRIDDLMLKWSLDEDFWLRRLAIDHQLTRKEATNTSLLEEIIVNNLGSKEFFINKAIGWSLRDYSKTNPDWVKDFLDKYQDRMNSISIKEAKKYL